LSCFEFHRRRRTEGEAEGDQKGEKRRGNGKENTSAKAHRHFLRFFLLHNTLQLRAHGRKEEKRKTPVLAAVSTPAAISREIHTHTHAHVYKTPITHNPEEDPAAATVLSTRLIKSKSKSHRVFKSVFAKQRSLSFLYARGVHLSPHVRRQAHQNCTIQSYSTTQLTYTPDPLTRRYTHTHILLWKSV
jgi:hypothetical protein